MSKAELATIAVTYFTEIRETDRVTLADDAPEWIRTVVREAHGSMIPDDWRYSAIRAFLAEWSDDSDVMCDVVDGLIDVYTSDLTGWLHSRNDRSGYVDDACSDLDVDSKSTIEQRLQIGQSAELQEIAGLIDASLDDALCFAEPGCLADGAPGSAYVVKRAIDLCRALHPRSVVDVTIDDDDVTRDLAETLTAFCADGLIVDWRDGDLVCFESGGET